MPNSVAGKESNLLASQFPQDDGRAGSSKRCVDVLSGRIFKVGHLIQARTTDDGKFRFHSSLSIKIRLMVFRAVCRGVHSPNILMVCDTA